MPKDRDPDREVRSAVFGDRGTRARPAPWDRSDGPEVRSWLPPGGGREDDHEAAEQAAAAEQAGLPDEAHPSEPGGEGESEVGPESPEGEGSEAPTDQGEEAQGEAELPEGPCARCEQTREEAAAERDTLLDALQDPYLRAAGELDRAADDLSEGFHDAVIELATRLASAVIQRGVELDREVMVGNLQRALEVAGAVSSVTLRCHPADAEILRKQAPELARATSGRAVEVVVRPSDDVDRGSCIVLFDEGIVDARWSAQLDRLAEAVRKTVQTHRSATGEPGEEA